MVLKSPVSNKHDLVKMKVNRFNQGISRVNSTECESDKVNFCSEVVETITLNDVVKYVPFRYAVVKLDIEGHEWNALSSSQDFFSSIFVTHIIMEWFWLQKTDNGRKVAEYLFSLNYEPYNGGNKLLNLSQWSSWAPEIYWKYKL